MRSAPSGSDWPRRSSPHQVMTCRLRSTMQRTCRSPTCDVFIRACLDQLPPLERFAATVEVSGLYTTGMVWLPHAEDRSVERILRCAAEAVTEMGARTAGEGILAGTPDTSFGPTYARKLSALADGPVADLRTELIARADELRELQRLEDEREAQEEGGG